MNDHAFFDAAFGRRDVPFLSGRVDQHETRHGAHFAEALPLGRSRRAPAGHLHAKDGVIVSGVDRGGLDSDFGPIGFEFFVEEHGQAGVDALTHFGVIGDDGDGLVGSDADKGVRREDGSFRGRFCG